MPPGPSTYISAIFSGDKTKWEARRKVSSPQVSEFKYNARNTPTFVFSDSEACVKYMVRAGVRLLKHKESKISMRHKKKGLATQST